MMVRPELPYSPGMEVMGVVDACGAGAERVAGPARRRDAEGRQRRLRRVRDLPGRSRRSTMPESIPLPDAAALYFPFHLAWLGLFDRAELQAGETRADPRRGRRIGIGRDPARGARRRARVRDRGHRREGAAVPRPRRRRRDQLQRRPTSPRSCSPRPANRGVDVVFDNVGEAVMEKSMQLHRVQRPLPDDGLRVEQGRRRRAVHRAAPRSRSGTSSCAACCSRTRRPRWRRWSRRRWAGTSRPASSASGSCARSSSSCWRARSSRSSAGSSTSTSIPAAIEAMANRETIGRTIVQL